MKNLKIIYPAIIFLFLSGLLFIGCAGSEKLLQQGKYDKSISKSVKVLSKKPTKVKEINTLKRTFKLANNEDIDKIKELKLSGQPDIYDAIVYHYKRLIDRQTKVARLNEDVLNRINFIKQDYTTQLVESKKKAADYFFTHASKLLQEKDKFKARKAFDELQHVKKYFPNYYNLDNKINEALALGTNRVILYIANDTKVVLPEDFENEMLKLSLKSLNKQWIDFDTYPRQNMAYDFAIYMNLKNIAVSPEKVKEIEYSEEKQIIDGFDYVLDDNGNVMKDSLGNDIKVDRYKTLKCFITETRLFKSSKVDAVLDFYDLKTNQLIKSFPLSSEFVFDYRFAVPRGDLEAMKKETIKLTKLKPVNFPSDLQMIFDTNEDLKSKVKSIISSNRNILINN